MIEVRIIGGTGYASVGAAAPVGDTPWFSWQPFPSHKEVGLLLTCFLSLRGPIDLTFSDLDRVELSGIGEARAWAETHILFAEAADNFKAYAVPRHRHLPEIARGPAASAGQPVAGQSVGLVFVPHPTPMIRGIHATPYARLTRNVDYQGRYESRCVRRWKNMNIMFGIPETQGLKHTALLP